MSLYSIYRQTQNFVYYKNSTLENPFLNHKFDDPTTSFEFIKDYFAAGEKEEAFSLGFEKELKESEKNQHTVALYFLGLHLSKLVEGTLSNFLENNLKDTSWCNFKHTWFLTCLYHDTANVIETSAYKKEMLGFFLGANNIYHNIYRHTPQLPDAQLFTFPEELVKNYFNYRIEHCICVDHGILGGYLLFDRLKKNYNAAYRNLKIQNPLANKYEEFEFEYLTWRIEHLDLFAIIADSIIAHNIWFSHDDKLYCHYGLDPLIISKTNKISLYDRPLLFFLSLLDTIEPVKCLTRKNWLTPVEALKSVDIQIKNKRKIVIKGCNNNYLYNEWFNDIKKAEDWLDLSVSTKGGEMCTITIPPQYHTNC